MIDRFAGEWRFLSNFWPSVVTLDGKLYPTVEHAYQAAKTDDPILRKEIRDATSPTTAKRLGRKAHLTSDWVTQRVTIMEGLLRQKFANGVLMQQLQATRPHELVEGNTWGDAFWGVCDGEGLNNLGRLLMLIRDEGSGMATVVNCKNRTTVAGDVYIGRGGPWGNPFEIDKHGTRDEVIARFRVHLWESLERGILKPEELAALHGKTLVCFCKPAPCHGDVLAAAAAWAHAQLQAQA